MLYNKKIPYINLIFAVVVSFVLIKIIDNYDSVFSVIDNLIAILSPFIFAFIIAYILNPLMSFLERKFKLKRSLSMALTYALIISLIAVFTTILLPKIAANLADLLKNIPEFSRQTQAWITNFVSKTKLLNNISSTDFLKNKNITSVIPKITNMLMISLDTILAKTISFTTSLINMIFGFIISIYILYDKEVFIKTIKKFTYIVLKRRNGERLVKLLKNIHYMLSLYIGTKAIDSSIIAIICFVGITFLNSPYTWLIAPIVGITNMIPYFGPFIGMIIAFVINVFFNPMRAVKVLIFLFFLQQFDAWYLDPKLIGGKVGLSPFLIIFAVTIGGKLFGVTGMLLAVPTMAVIKIYIDKYLKNHTEVDCENS
ncbi:AI-2E family transporter [Clostridium ganghwense]|uniref:AI-2E family transporter n=1 Tax=Clostridium ganghwense TaxID=312089 RepID=A0ABT4CNU0_9CLOT|nr:AI-2E family transporter [Clostridium ganghwense]MCY6370729.1 AI-2E family transporter [Clostridium ganghwense]